MHLVTSYDAVADAGKNRPYLLLPQFERSPSPEPEPPRRRPPWPGAPERGVDMAPYPRSPEPGRAAVGMPYLEKVEKVYPKEEEEKPAARGGRGRSYGGAGDDDDEKDKYYRNRLTERWSWRTSTSPPPFSGGRRITGHALHPDGRTIFVSVEKTHARRHPGDEDDEEDGTFSYDTERGGEWTRRGGWHLPFKGQAHYDRHLDAWGGALRERRVGGDPKLVPMGGGGGTFCVVESAPRAGLELIGLGSLLGDGDKFELRVTVFHAKYGENGELLMTTTASAAAAASHTYALSRYLSNFHAPAFWMFHHFWYDSGDDGDDEVETAYESGGDDDEDEVETEYDSDDDEVEAWYDSGTETSYDNSSDDEEDEEVEPSYNSDGELRSYQPLLRIKTPQKTLFVAMCYEVTGGGASRTMCSPPSRSRAYAASGGTGGSHYRSRCLRSCSCDEHSRRRRHLYLVLDDWKEGYSLHKLDLNANSGDGGDDPSPPRRLPAPLLRLGFRTLGSSPRVGALGSKIVFIGQRHPDQFTGAGDDDDDGDDEQERGLTLVVYNTATAAVDVSHHVPDDVRLACTCDAVAAGNRLYLLLLSDQSHFERSPESCRRRDNRAVGMPYVEKVEEVAAGNRVYLMLPDQSERSPPPPPESGSPDLAVAMRYLEKVEQVYDDEVETADDDEYMDAEKKHVVVAYSERLTERWWTFCEQPLTFLGAESHQSLGDPKLLPMGGGAFCVIVESAPRGADSVGDGDKLLLRVAVFRAKYGKNGELFMTTAAGGRGSCQMHTYVRSRYLVDFHAPAFWM
uniref:Uncharacterized protein n=1 Tax=Oryza barthii TaxID=65489 RepID=A0A0D3FVV3_9ORYZ